MKQPKHTAEEVRAVEDTIIRVCENLTDFGKATLYLYLHKQGMDLLKANTIRLQAGATN